MPNHPLASPGFLSGSLLARLKADYYARRASRKVRALDRQRLVANTAMYWPEIPVRYVSGIQPTRKLIETRAYPIYDGEPRWPADIEPPAAAKVLTVSSDETESAMIT